MSFRDATIFRCVSREKYNFEKKQNKKYLDDSQLSSMFYDATNNFIKYVWKNCFAGAKQYVCWWIDFVVVVVVSLSLFFLPKLLNYISQHDLAMKNLNMSA